MIVWLRIDGSPSRQFVQDIRALGFVNRKIAMLPLLKDPGTLRATTGTENASIGVTLKNEAAQCTALFANPPLGASATLYGDDVELFSGTVTQVDLSSTDCKVSIEA